jgi:nitrate reductase gamma subunit
MKKDFSPLNSGWFYILMAILLVVLATFLKLNGKEWQLMIVGILLQVAIIVAIWRLFFRRIFKRKKRKL